MNYFAHYYFDHLPGEETHNFGLLMPDLVRNFLKGKKLKKPDAVEGQTPPHAMLAEGTRKHFHRDHRFHGSHVFKSIEGQLNNTLRPLFADLEIPRYWFAAHLLSEMMIDRILMKEAPALMDQFYVDVMNADTNHINEHLAWAGIEETDSFQERLNRFRKSQYLRQYVHNPALIYSLNRIYIFTGAGSEWSSEQYRRLEESVNPMEEMVGSMMTHLKEEMK